jgi:hypothetical protein
VCAHTPIRTSLPAWSFRYGQAWHVRLVVYHLMAACSQAGEGVHRLMALPPGSTPMNAGTVSPSNHASAPPITTLPSFTTGTVRVDEEGMLTNSTTNTANKEAHLGHVPPPPVAASTSGGEPMKVCGGAQVDASCSHMCTSLQIHKHVYFIILAPAPAPPHAPGSVLHAE